jgi:hypothetical protein
VGRAELQDAIAGVMPTVSRALRRGDWLTVYRTIHRLGEAHGVADPDEYAWHALRGLDARARCPDVLS